MGRGGKREAGEGKKLGRPKAERPTTSNVATRVLTESKAEQTWLELINLEKRRLGLLLDEKVPAGYYPAGHLSGYYQFSIIPLTNLLRYLEDRASGRPVDTVNHLHDKPIEMNVVVSLAESIQKARKRVSA